MDVWNADVNQITRCCNKSQMSGVGLPCCALYPLGSGVVSAVTLPY